jgi:hypothetical protein
MFRPHSQLFFPPTPRPAELARISQTRIHYTCSSCGNIRRMCFIEWLDDKPICEDCFRDRRMCLRIKSREEVQRKFIEQEKAKSDAE